MTARPTSSYMEFWGHYLRQAGKRHPEWQGLGRPTKENYLYQTSGVRHCRIAPGFKGDGRLSHELVIMSPDGDANLEAFTALRERCEAGERVYGRSLHWDRREGAKRCLIGEYRAGALDDVNADIDEYVDWFIDCGERLRRTLDRFGGIIAPYLDERV